jgi:hypothetical protein
MSKYEYFLKKGIFFYLKFRFAVIIISIVTTVESLEQTWHFSMQAPQNKVTLGCRLLYDCTIWTSQDYTVCKSVYLYYLYFPTIAKLYFCMTVQFVILYDYLHFHGVTAPVGQGPLIIEASRSHSDPPHLIGLLRPSDQPDEEICTRQHTTLTKDRDPCLRRDSNPQSSKRAAAYPRLSATGIGSIWLYV